jgi:hypothetical protein
VLIFEPAPGADAEVDAVMRAARRFEPVRSLVEHSLESASA